jgi:hypothetical protein
MDVPLNVVGRKHTITPARLRFAVFRRCWAALLDRQERVSLRERLCDLSDKELRDIGIARVRSTTSPRIALSTREAPCSRREQARAPRFKLNRPQNASGSLSKGPCHAAEEVSPGSVRTNVVGIWSSA